MPCLNQKGEKENRDWLKRSIDTRRNSKDPPNTRILVSVGYQRGRPDDLRYIPYPIPSTIKPARIGRVWGNAAIKAGKAFLSSITHLMESLQN